WSTNHTAILVEESSLGKQRDDAVFALSQWKAWFSSQYPCEAFAERPCPKVFRSDNKRPIGFDVAKALVQLNDCHAIGESFSVIELGRDDDLVALVDIAALSSNLGRLHRRVRNALVSFTSGR